MSKNLLLIFTRNPELGKVKTRLAKSIGDEAALEIYKFLLNHTKEVTEKGDFDIAVYYSVKIRENDIWTTPKFKKYAQHGDDLGERMQNAFEEGFDNNYDKIVIVGSDLYDLELNHINKAFDKLDTNDVVIGPAEDGGYYLLGLKKVIPEIFKNKEWGTETVRQDTLNDLQKLSVHLLTMLNDIDVFEDIQQTSIFDQFYK
ncbi:TIGR04282 family arsenosugar biosynthesis glycosyltransferase [Tenacibaculum xiamenense]|uniref:TIGR04282 family arsenosugar biosynthesis glycosyltransferase n=1 Tax=Tenacibaculum xiamenense TaxID=1261553 RepID=UPI00389645BA